MAMAFFTQIARVTDNLFLSAAAAVSSTKLKHYGITHVINCTIEVPHVRSSSVESIRVTVDDTPNSRLGVHFDRCADKIRQVADSGGKTLVHCVAGVSRSASICIAYLMKHHRMSLREAFYHVKSKRPVIRPNVGFFRQLIDYEKKLYSRSTVSMVQSPIGWVPSVYEAETKHMVPMSSSLF